MSVSKCRQCGRIMYIPLTAKGICIYCTVAETKAEVLGCPICGHEKFWYRQAAIVHCLLLRGKEGIEIQDTKETPDETLTGFICDSCGQEFSMASLENVYE